MPEKRPRVVDVHSLPCLRRVLPLPKYWRVWFASIFRAVGAVVNFLLDVGVEARPSDVTARQLLATRAPWSWMRLVENLQNAFTKRSRNHDTSAIQQHSRLDGELVLYDHYDANSSTGLLVGQPVRTKSTTRASIKSPRVASALALH